MTTKNDQKIRADSPFSASLGSRRWLTAQDITGLKEESLSYFDELPVRYWEGSSGYIERGYVIGVQFGHDGLIVFVVRNEDGWTKHRASALHTEIVGR